MKTEHLILLNQELTLEAKGNQVVSIRNKNITKQGMRVFQDNEIYNASFVGETDAEYLIQHALDNSASAIPYRYKLPEISPLSIEHLHADPQIKVHFTQEYNQGLKRMHAQFPDYIFSGQATYSRSKESLNQASIESDSFSWYFMYRHKDSPSIIDGYFGAFGLADWSFEKETERYSALLEAHQTEVSIENGTYPVIFSHNGQLLGKLAMSSRVDYYKENAVLFKRELGNKILSDKLTLWDISYDPQYFALTPFDGEGFQRSHPRLPLIEQGVFKNLICDQRNGEKYGMASTGNGHRNYNSGVYLGHNTLGIAPGKRPALEILKDFEKCLIIELADGGDFTDLGDFSTPVQLGFLAEKGVIKGKLPQVTLKSNLKKIFGDDLIEIASDTYSGLDHNPALFFEMELFNN